MDFGKGFWFLNSHATLLMPSAAGADGISVLQFRMTVGDAPPWHLHRTEDEVFHVEEGEIRFRIGDTEQVVRAGKTVLGPQGVPHGYRVLSDTARMLVITKGGFERLVCGLARPAETDGPPIHVVPSEAMQAHLVAACGELNIDILGPPLA